MEGAGLGFSAPSPYLGFGVSQDDPPGGGYMCRVMAVKGPHADTFKCKCIYHRCIHTHIGSCICVHEQNPRPESDPERTWAPAQTCAGMHGEPASGFRLRVCGCGASALAWVVAKVVSLPYALLVVCLQTSAHNRGSQKVQYRLIKEYTLNSTRNLNMILGMLLI